MAIVPKGRCGYLYAGVFDGHSGAASADWLVEHLYAAFSQHLDDDMPQATGSGTQQLRLRLSMALLCSRLSCVLWMCRGRAADRGRAGLPAAAHLNALRHLHRAGRTTPAVAVGCGPGLIKAAQHTAAGPHSHRA